MTFHVSSIVAKALTFPLGKPDSEAVVGLHRTLYGHPKPGEARGIPARLHNTLPEAFGEPDSVGGG